MRILDGPKGTLGREALVIDRTLVTAGGGESDPLEDYDANIEVLVDGVRVGLWVGWVERIQ